MTGDKFEKWAGKEDYIQPPTGWFGKALQVGSPNQPWLGTGDKAWPIVYHGIYSNMEFALPKIIKGGLRPGPNNAYTNGVPAIYCTPDFNLAFKSYTSDAKSIKGLRVVMQCRVNPDTVIKHTT